MKQFALPILIGFATVASAQTAAPSKIAVIQMQAALASTKDGQAALEKLQKTLVEPKRKEIEGEQAELKDLQEQLQRGSNTLSQAKKDDLQRQIDAKNKNINRDMQDAQDELEQEQGKIVQELMGKMSPIIEKYLTENGYAILLDVSDPQRSGVFWAASAIDITQAVVELYDKAAPAPAAAKPAAVKPTAVAPAKPAAPKPAPVK